MSRIVGAGEILSSDFEPAHEARGGQRVALSVQSDAAAMQDLYQRSTVELSPYSV